MIRSQRAGAGPPRMIVTRAALDCDSIDAAAALIAGAPRAGAFHLSLAQAGDSRLVSLEFTHSGCSTLAAAQPQCHANHLVHPANATEAQIVTDSLRARQEPGGEPVAPPAASRDPLAVLWAGARPELGRAQDQTHTP